MLQTLSAGKQLDLLTASEVRSVIREWMVDVARGARPVKIASGATADANGTVSIGGTRTLTGGTLGPAPGFWWAVTRLAVRVDGVPAAFEIYENEPHTHSLVRDVPGEANGYASFGAHELLVGNADQLLIRCASVTPTTGTATVTGSAMEFPEALLWKWTTG
jgi:hypothetical protein